MSALLKASDPHAQSGVAALALRPAPQPGEAPAPATRHPADNRADQSQQTGSARTPPGREHLQAENELAELRQKLQRAAEDADLREETAYERGRRDGRETVETQERERTDRFAATLERIERQQADRLKEYELLALQLAQAALARILGDRSAHASLIEDAIHRCLDALRREMVVAVHVSAKDFIDAAQTARIEEKHGNVSIDRSDDLNSGECHVELKLGQIDLGLAGQWHRLTEFFARLAQEGDAA